MIVEYLKIFQCPVPPPLPSAPPLFEQDEENTKTSEEKNQLANSSSGKCISNLCWKGSGCKFCYKS